VENDELWNHVARMQEQLLALATTVSEVIAELLSRSEYECVPSMQRADQMVRDNDGGENSPGRARAGGRRAGEVQDSDGRDDADSAVDERGEREQGSSGSQTDLPATARHLIGATRVEVIGSAYNGYVGKLVGIVVGGSFGASYGVVDIEVPAKDNPTKKPTVELGRRIRADQLRAI
jgi:hypothetical protein